MSLAQRNIEVLIGRLITDEAFRDAFQRDAKAAIERFAEAGVKTQRVTEVTRLGGVSAPASA